MPGRDLFDSTTATPLLDLCARHFFAIFVTWPPAPPGRALEWRREDVFLDLKLHEIPNAVAGAIKAAGKLGVTMATVRAPAGSAVLRTAVTAAQSFPQLRVLALTVITSLTDNDLLEIGIASSVEAQVLLLSTLAIGSGCHGVIASAQEVVYLRQVRQSKR